MCQAHLFVVNIHYLRIVKSGMVCLMLARRRVSSHARESLLLPMFQATALTTPRLRRKLPKHKPGKEFPEEKHKLPLALHGLVATRPTRDLSACPQVSLASCLSSRSLDTSVVVHLEGI